MTLQERVRQFIAYKRLSVHEFEMRCGLSNGSVAKMGENTRRATVTAIADSFPELNTVWLLTGTGEMLDLPEDAAPGTHRIVYYPEVMVSMGEMLFDEHPDEQQMYIVIPGFSESTMAVKAYGDSMAPEINSGDIVLLSAWKESYIEWGRKYLIVTAEGHRAIKILQPHPDDDGLISCHSVNRQYSPFSVPRNEIIRLFLVHGSIRKESV